MDIDITQALKDTENSLRDFIAAVLKRKFGEDWIEKCGVSSERLDKWQKRKVEEEKRQKFAVVEERLIYYADFYDLKPILKKHWDGEFSQAMGDWKTMEVWLDELERLRDPEAHRRELLPHQKNLVLGIAGEIRTRLIKYRSKQETAEDYFPRLESVRDSIGNIWTPEKDLNVHTESLLRPNDSLDFVITANDPYGDKLEYGIWILGGIEYDTPDDILWRDIFWRKENSFHIEILKEHVGKCRIQIFIRSPRNYHALGEFDDLVIFHYVVLPPKDN